jgi:hypothetical protein
MLLPAVPLSMLPPLEQRGVNVNTKDVRTGATCVRVIFELNL